MNYEHVVDLWSVWFLDLDLGCHLFYRSFFIRLDITSKHVLRLLVGLIVELASIGPRSELGA